MVKLESIDELRVFTQIVESGSLAAAARALGLPTSTISRRLAQLEERAGRPLLYRSTRSLSFAEDGQAFLDGARRILQAVDALEMELETSPDRLAGTVKVGVPSVLAADLLEALSPLLAENLELRVQLVIHDRHVSPVAAGLDLVVVGGALEDSSLVSKRVGAVQLALAARRDYLDQHGRPATPAELTKHHTLHFLTDPPATSWVLVGPDGRSTEVPVAVRLEANDGRALLDAIKTGLGIGTLSPRQLRAHPDLERVLPEHHFRAFPIFVVYPVSGRRSKRLRAVVQALQSALVK